MERINKLLQHIADRGDEIKDLRTRHELTVKRNTEASPSCSDQHAAHARMMCACCVVFSAYAPVCMTLHEVNA